MPALAFAIPLLPDKTQTARNALKAFATGDRTDDYRSSRHRLGITREAVWIQESPSGGDVSVVYLESPDLQAALMGMATSQEPFDRWFREHVRDVHGIALEDGFPPPEQLLDFRT
jgi:hypothetical protein